MWKNFQKDLEKRFKSSESFVSLFLGLLIVLVLGILVFNFVSNRVKQGNTTKEAAKTEQGAQVEKGGKSKTYTVAAGDTLWSIAEKTYNSGYKWTDIAKANNLANADKLEVGQVLKLPEVSATAPSINGGGASVGTISGNSYTVVRGDSLWNISIRAYGDGYGWVKIAQANKLTNPDLIHAGNILVLPR